MRVSFSIKLSPESGKQNFAIRLAKELRNQDVIITDKNPDINIVFLKGIKKRCKNIFRLDGVLMNTAMNYNKKNKILWNIMKKCDGVIFQNLFCKEASDRFLGKVKNYCIILNGADPNNFRKTYKHKKPYILAMCRWRGHKRLKSIVDGFLSSSLVETHDLIVCGKPDHIKRHQSVLYFGKCRTKKVETIVSSCLFTVHLAYVDWCPNSVIESLVASKPVLHTDSGGTKQIVKDSGICVKDHQWNFKPIDLYNPPPLSMEDIIQGYNKMRLFSEAALIYREDLFISNIAKQYIKFFRKILNS